MTIGDLADVYQGHMVVMGADKITLADTIRDHGDFPFDLINVRIEGLLPLKYPSGEFYIEITVDL